MGKQFEYKTISFPISCSPGMQRGRGGSDPVAHAEIDGHLNEHGRDGWQVVGVASAQDGFLTVVLKGKK